LFPTLKTLALKIS